MTLGCKYVLSYYNPELKLSHVFIRNTFSLCENTTVLYYITLFCAAIMCIADGDIWKGEIYNNNKGYTCTDRKGYLLCWGRQRTRCRHNTVLVNDTTVCTKYSGLFCILTFLRFTKWWDRQSKFTFLFYTSIYPSVPRPSPVHTWYMDN